jgi:ABC-type nitrate/sulfonate/bicarbonate transport system substrate-binding protein
LKQIITILAVLITVACSSGLAQAQKLQQVRVALSTPTPHMAPLYIAKDKRFYEK